jgi:hypothetical protein
MFPLFCPSPVYLQVFLFSILHGDDWLVSRPGRFTVGKGPQYRLDRRQIGCRAYLEMGIIPTESRRFAIQPVD